MLRAIGDVFLGHRRRKRPMLNVGLVGSHQFSVRRRVKPTRRNQSPSRPKPVSGQRERRLRRWCAPKGGHVVKIFDLDTDSHAHDYKSRSMPASHVFVAMRLIRDTTLPLLNLPVVCESLPQAIAFAHHQNPLLA